jgi:hypothetical protein
MKKALLFCLLPFLLLGCNAVVNLAQPQFPTGSSGSRTTTGWNVVLDSSIKGAAIGSSEPITSFKSTSPCQYRKTEAGANFNLLCNAPNTISLDSGGEIQLRVLNVAPIVGTP